MYQKGQQQKLKKIVKKLDDITRKIVIARDKRCVLCGSVYRLECAHFIKRRFFGVRWDLRNCNCLCNLCNGRDDVEPWHYREFMQSIHGQEIGSDLTLAGYEIIKPIQQHTIYRELQEVAKQFGIRAPDLPLTK